MKNSLHIYNTAERKKVPFVPLDPNHIKMYVCGPTVYNYIHIGNARPVVVFDTLYRVLKTLYPKVSYARNITDIDDKIMAEAKAKNVDITDISEQFADAYKEDTLSLNSLLPDHTPYATAYVDEMVTMVEDLIEKGHAYESDNHVLFAVESMPSYGKLSNRNLDDMLAGARVDVADYKRHPGDFVLWKPSADDQPGWASPWGRGRPGWNLECSAMIKALFGKTIDIHGGGKDLVFPHHENERAQSECAHNGEQFVKYWMHNGYLNIDGEKMSKSLGNFKTVRELLTKFDGEVLRLALLSAQYRSDADFSASLLDQAKANLDSLYGARQAASDTPVGDVDNALDNSKGYLALLDDLNTPLAMSELLQLAKKLNASPADSSLLTEFIALSNLLGLVQSSPDTWFSGGADEDEKSKIDALVQARFEAKQAKDWAKADEIRNALKEQGIEILDSKDGSTWRKV